MVSSRKESMVNAQEAQSGELFSIAGEEVEGISGG